MISIKLSTTILRGPSNPALLLHPQIPKPMSNVAPRVIMGQEWWDTERKAAFTKANYCCEACGVSGPEALFFPRLEGHETYSIDFVKARMTYLGTVALCHACHNFIHKGRLKASLARGLVTKSKFNQIIRHGNALIKNLKHPFYPVGQKKWADWRMEFDGKLYPPYYKSYEEWLQLAPHEL